MWTILFGSSGGNDNGSHYLLNTSLCQTCRFGCPLYGCYADENTGGWRVQ